MENVDSIILPPNTKEVLEKRYLKKDTKGRVTETPEGMFKRVADHVAQAEEKFGNPKGFEKYSRQFYTLMTEFKFLPNSPTLMNAGNKLGQLAACFVLPVDDSLEAIFETVKNSALIHKSGGGTGFSFSKLRPKDSRVGTTGGVASGPVSFMKIFNTATEQVKQGGTRRGANMAILRVDHPDVMDFIYCKKNNDSLNNFNISVGVTDEFMAAAKTESDYELIDPRDGKVAGKLNAADVYKELVEHAWHNGDPGIIFLDRMNRDNPTPALGEIESTNPCGEQPLLPMEACNLGSINLSKFINASDNGEKNIAYDSLRETVSLAVRFLDNTIEMSNYPLQEIDDMVKGNRKIGLGVMGFADMLFELGIPYNSQKAVDLAEEIMCFISSSAHNASEELGQERGSFGNFDKSIFASGKRKRAAMRNATATTIAPTGTLSIIAGCSSGIEPVFALSFVRKVMDDARLVEVNPFFEQTAKTLGFYNKDLMDIIAQNNSISEMTEIPDEVRNIFVTAHDVSPLWHIRMQAAFQNHTDNAVSKTVNLPGEATVEEVRDIYNMAFETGCKGITIYRDGSKVNQVLSTGQTEEPKVEGIADVKERPDTLEGFTTRIKTGMGHLYVTVTELNGKPFEVFATIGKSGKSTTAKTEAIGRLISLALRAGVNVEDIIDQIKGIGGEYAVFQKSGRVLSIPDAIGMVLEDRYKNADWTQKTENSFNRDACPDCGAAIAYEEGCKKCHGCGFSECG